MKVRFGFVSNSSSSSFCLYGANVSTKTVIDFLESKGIKIPEGQDSSYEVAEILNKYFRDNNINMTADDYYPDGWTGINIGRDPFTIGPNETGQQFRESVNKVLKSIDKNLNGDAMVEGWYNG